MVVAVVSRLLPDSSLHTLRGSVTHRLLLVAPSQHALPACHDQLHRVLCIVHFVDWDNRINFNGEATVLIIVKDSRMLI